MAKAKLSKKSAKAQDKNVSVDVVDQEDDQVEVVDEDQDVSDEDQDVEAVQDDQLEDDEQEDEAEKVAQDILAQESTDVTVQTDNGDEKAVSVLILKNTPRFLIGTMYIEPLEKGQKLRLPKHVAEHLQERGRAQIL
jgi:hypothetical protein